MNTPHYPKDKELKEANLEGLKFLFSKVEEHEKKIKALERQINSIVLE